MSRSPRCRRSCCREYVAQLELAVPLKSPAHFAAHLSRGTWQPYRHLKVTSEAIVAMVEDDDCDLLVVDQPVRHGKTELCSRWTPAVVLVQVPGPPGAVGVLRGGLRGDAWASGA